MSAAIYTRRLEHARKQKSGQYLLQVDIITNFMFFVWIRRTDRRPVGSEIPCRLHDRNDKGQGGVGAVSGNHDIDIRPDFDTIHEVRNCETDDATLDCFVGLEQVSAPSS